MGEGAFPALVSLRMNGKPLTKGLGWPLVRLFTLAPSPVLRAGPALSRRGKGRPVAPLAGAGRAGSIGRRAPR